MKQTGKQIKIIKRYKRFLTDVEDESNEVLTVHTPNTGSMKTCLEPGWPGLIVKAKNVATRKYAYTLSMTHNGSTWIGVNTSLTNHLVEEAFLNGKIPELQQYNQFQREVKIQNSRIDFLFSNSKTSEKCYVEVKNVTLLAEPGVASFPDAKSERALKHVQDLMAIKKQESSDVKMLYVVQREDVSSFRVARDIDPKYASAVEMAKNEGLDILVYQCTLSPNSITIENPLPYLPS